MDSKRRSSALPIFVALSVILFASSVTAQIQVNSTSPSAAPQGTVKLNVTISGTGFENGDTVQWLVSGTTNAGGVTVNSTSFNNSSQLTANITIADNAVVGGYDVVVTNTNGRTGKGTDKFTVNPMAVVSTLYSADPNGSAVTVQGDNLSGPAVYLNTPESCTLAPPKIAKTCIIMSLLPNDWYLRLKSDSGRTIYLNFVALDGPDESALDGYYLGAAVTTRCFDANNSRIDIPIVVAPGTSYSRCSLRVNFTSNGISYTYAMGPTYNGTGWSTVTCTVGIGSCTEWTITPTPESTGPNPNVANLYSVTKQGSTLIGTYKMSFNVLLTQ